MICANCGNVAPIHQAEAENSNHDAVLYARVEELLRLLSPLPPSETLELSQMSVKIDKEMEGYETMILQLESRIMYLRTKQEFLRGRKDRLTSLTAPIRRLPTEVLSLIFINLCDDESGDIILGHARYKCRRSYPFDITSVCHRWREVAIATPQIWSHICLDWSLGYYVNLGYLLYPLQMALERSKGSPLSLYVDMRCNEEYENPLLELLATQSHRWVEIRFLYLDAHILPDSLDSDSTFPALQRLVFRDNDEDRLSFPSDLTLFRNSPKLRALTIETAPQDGYASIDQRFPWNQIRHLELHLDRCERVFKLLRLCYNLESIIFASFNAAAIRGSDIISDGLEPQTSNASKVEFRMSAQTEDVEEGSIILSKLVDAITLPKVHTLMFTRDTYPDGSYQSQWPRSSIDSFFRRSKCSLTTLYIDGHALSDKDALALLTLTPALSHLRIQENKAHSATRSSPTISPLFLQALHAFGYSSFRASTAPLVPKLTSLHITTNGKGLNDTMFTDMVVSRWIPEVDHADVVGVDRLRSVKLGVFDRTFDEGQRRRLECLESVGLKVEVFQKTI
ncbi:hypothetical protein VKT23_020657 [Stygiomarasmius scandens]|uniref:F-box domain-containing protein n=1 Tax=Marasmiellus scandens TaxID=2682957 RepID=A0ABR1IIL2_9AGAR